MRSSLLGLFGLSLVSLSACSLSTTKDSITLKSQTKFVEDNVGREAPADWTGENIVINTKGTGISVNGGLEINFDASATRVRANARMIAYADGEDKASADQSILDAKGTYTLTTSGTTTNIACGHGGSHGSSDSGKSGCEKLIVTVPAGSTAKTISVKGLSGNGGIVVRAGGAIIGTLELNSAGGDIDITADANLGSTISAVSEQADDITLDLPAGFASDKVVLVADVSSIDVSAFPGLENNAGRGTAGTGAKVISVESKEFAGTTGKITLR